MPRKRSKYYRKKRRITDDMINIAAVIVVIIFLWSLFIYFGTRGETKKINTALPSVASFQIPFKTYDDLHELTVKKNMNFADVLTIFCLENRFFPNKSAVTPTETELNEFMLQFAATKSQYVGRKVKPYYELLNGVTSEIQYFPIPYGFEDYTFSDSFGAKREYGGERVHEGCDIMDRGNIRGRLPVVSMTDGVISNIGWNEKGGYRVGIMTSKGNYYYYAHFDGFAPGLVKGKAVLAGDLLGYMGDTGYSKVEGTKGNFPVHLHMGICPKTSLSKKEFWMNPYVFLRFAEKTKVILKK